MTPTRVVGGDGWILSYEVRPGVGLVLREVSHANYRLARDMRVVAVWAGTGDPHAPDPAARGQLRKLRLGDTCPVAADGDPAIRAIAAPEDFPYYPGGFALTASFLTPTQVFPGGVDRLSITQTYQFCDYGSDPAHEPGGVLPAARLLPLVTARCEQIGDGSPDVRYLRIDYRMNYALEAFSPDPPRPGPNSPRAAGTPNQAGIFRDSEGAPALLGVPGPGQIPPGAPVIPVLPPTIAQQFAAGEKPLQYEVVGRGLEYGAAYSPSGAPWSWDNIHQWPAAGNPPWPAAQQLPDTPGAFDACHTHWRWGAVAADPSGWAAKAGILAGAGPQFQGYNYGWSTARGGPLVDHRVHNQSITFAIARDRADADADVSTENFADLFSGSPQDIRAGDELIQWFSIELFRRPDDMLGPWEGTVFIHGLYFAHSLEPSSVAARAQAAGLFDPLHNPPEQPGRPWRFNPA